MEHEAESKVVAETRAWVNRAVIGLNLCPFARAAQTKDQIRYVVTEARTSHQLLAALREQLQFLADTDPTTTAQAETTLLIHPNIFSDFMDYNDFLDDVDAEIVAMGLEGELQVASFHPNYQFAGTSPDDITNVTNQSPFQTLHILRESSVEQAVETFPDINSIYETNMRTVQALGRDNWDALQAQCRNDAEGSR